MGMDLKYVARRVKLIEMLSWERLFIPSWLSTHQSTKSSAGVNPQGRSTEKVKLLLNDSHLEPQAVRPQHNCGDDNLSSENTALRETQRPACQMSKWFYDISTGTATRAARCDSLLDGLRSLEFQLWRKHDCDRTTSEMSGLSPKIISGDSQ
jgi:hypothetical protein